MTTGGEPHPGCRFREVELRVVLAALKEDWQTGRACAVGFCLEGSIVDQRPRGILVRAIVGLDEPRVLVAAQALAREGDAEARPIDLDEQRLATKIRGSRLDHVL